MNREVPNFIPVWRSEDAQAERALEEKIDLAGLSLHPPFEVNAVLALARLVYELRNDLGQFDTILSDDCSGRLVSLLVRRLVNDRRQNLGEDPAQLFFITAGTSLGRPLVYSQVSSFLEKKQEMMNRTLVVTEIISSGRSIGMFMEIMEKLEIHFNVAALAMAESQVHQEYPLSLTKRLYYGMSGCRFYSSFYNSSANGVTKPKIPSPFPEKRNYWDRGVVNQARADIELLSKVFQGLVD